MTHLPTDTYNLYQSDIRQYIQTHIYRKPTFHADFLGQKYFGMIKKKQIWPLSIQWHQILWVRIQMFLHDPDYIITEFAKLRGDLASNYGDMFVQIGLIDELCQYHSHELKDEKLREDIKSRRIFLEQMLQDRFGLVVTVRENMPMANVTIDCRQWREQIQAWFSTSCRNHIKKWLAQQYHFEPQASNQDISDFWTIWQETMHHKGVSTITKQMYHHLLDYLSEWNKGGLYLVKHKHAIVSGSICLIDGPVMLYLYGASDRNRGNTWWHHLLKSHLIQYAIDHKLETFDFFGAAPSGYDDHHLAGVSRFKESFWGLKTEYYGSYDIVTNHILYQMMKWRNT